MHFTETLKQWLKEQEWMEEPAIDEEKQTIALLSRLWNSSIRY